MKILVKEIILNYQSDLVSEVKYIIVLIITKENKNKIIITLNNENFKKCYILLIKE